jgi:hypothetical protein
MFLPNKYTDCYNNIIARAKSRVLSKEIYTEKHHIYPKSLGGSNSKDNLVRLTAREHFICHRLLVKMVENKAKYQMIKACEMMTKKNNWQSRYQITSRTYEKLKKDASLAMSLLTKGKPKHTPKSKKILSEKATNRVSGFKGKTMSNKSRQLIAQSHNKPCISPKGERFNSTKEAGLAYGITGGGIRALIKTGKKGWRYERPEDQQVVELKRLSKVKSIRKPQSSEHILKRIKSRKESGHYKDRKTTIEKMKMSAKLRYQ